MIRIGNRPQSRPPVRSPEIPFTALEIASSVDEEQVADLFVRINSKGVKLNQADFILTLLSVFWNEGRKTLEDFCHLSCLVPSANKGLSAFNYFIRAYNK
jgi:hypothetical protein